ncbi:HD-GYP domain-containing protein [Aquibacillus koreensis]|uniref:HD-GYP domain-containing protein n=1 Tax=Aquibacillus koreensis TaxID=279446 RepID=A0A9X4AL17_9BACI|nr:HD-GYP domain-containing protein [Aquibacillus koreensis]MCT2536863.1 HD-GYP domain-containing protein [Aquibacillus koreensis]MDC3422005.1 HD-GYP domain-containing protein [Aquibacillus koreensis]
MTDLNNSLSFGDILEHNIVTNKGVLLLNKGTQLTDNHLTLLSHFNWKYDSVNKVESSNRLQESTQIKVKKLITECIDQYSSIIEKIEIGEKPDFFGVFEGMKETYNEIEGLDNAIDVIYGFQDLDRYTYQHSVNVSLLSGLIGKILNASENELSLLINMGIVHDIGKVRIDNTILNKTGKLTNAEFNEIKKHTLFGYQILLELMASEKIAEGALLHHERLDGSGYPIGKSGDDIPFLIQILSIADTFDAICTERSYHEQRSPFFGISVLLQEAKDNRFNEEIVIKFVRYLMNQYKGKKIMINNGEIGEIIYVPYEEPHKPIIKSNEKMYDLRKVMLKILDFAEKDQ